VGCVSDDQARFACKNYDAEGNVVSEFDERGFVTSYTYDALDRVETVSREVKTGVTETTVYKYDTHDNVTEVVDASGAVTRYEYDDFGQMVRLWGPDGRTIKNQYNAAGQLEVSVEGGVDVDQYRAGYTYDNIGRLIETHFERLERRPV